MVHILGADNVEQAIVMPMDLPGLEKGHHKKGIRCTTPHTLVSVAR